MSNVSYQVTCATIFILLSATKYAVILIEKRILVWLAVLFLVLLSAAQASAQLVVQNGPTPIQLAEIIAGPGVTVSNATVTGSNVAYGSFNGAASNIGLPSGVILTTGPINIAVGPNNSGSAGQQIGTPGNPMLNGLAGAQTFDAIVLEFDFIPLSNTVEFNYVFGSEEYPEYVNSIFNDAFAFFISGPGIAATYGTANYNMARVPGTTQPVTINTVNGGLNNQHYFNNANGQTVQYDGFTRPLVATANVQACETYHIMMMIADAGDGAWDSGVFIEEGSLTSNAVEIQASTATADSTAYEGCSSATITFTLGNVVNTPTTITYNVLGTATNGVDFNQIPVSVTIPANQLSTSFQITPIEDGIIEGIETIIIDVQTSICGTDAIVVYLNDLNPLSIQAFGDTSFCPGGMAKLWAEPQGGGGGYNFTWSNGATTDTIYVSPATTTDYTVSVTDYCASGNPVSNPVTVTIDPAPNADAGLDQIYCTGDQVVLTTSGADSYAWYEQPSTTPSSNEPTIVLYPTGTVNIMLVAWIGVCSDTDYVSLSELPADPIVAFGDTAVCRGTAVNIGVNGASVGSTFSWSPTTGLSSSTVQQPVATAPATGWYVATVTSPNGCIGIDSVLITLYEIPQPDFIFQDVCLNEGSTFINTSTVVGSTITSYDWNFDDMSQHGTTSPVVHTYAIDGSYDVTLTVTSAQGCVDSITQTTVIYPLPVADFASQSDCADRIIGFTDNSTVSSGAVVAWDWDFGNQQVSNLQTPVGVSYSTSNTYPVQLEVTTAFGCMHDTTISITIYPNPTANFSVADVCLLLESEFIDQSVSAGNYPITAFDWAFSNGAVSTLQNPSVTFNASNQYTATLIVTDSLGCQDSLTYTNVVVHPLPEVSFTTTIACLNDATLFTNTTTISLGSIAANAWDFGDLNTSTLASPMHTYADDITYAVQLVATSDRGCIDSITQDVIVGPLPVADFDFNNDCLDKLINFTDNSTVSSGNILGWMWDFANQETSNVQNPVSQQYPMAGLFGVNLTVVTDLGCVHDTTKTIEVYPMPIAAFTWDSACFGLPIQFSDLSLANGNYPIDSYDWSFSDGQISDVVDPQVAFGAAGPYVATLTVTTTMGCRNTLTDGAAVVYPLPNAQFSSVIRNCLNDTTQFEDLSTVENVLNDVIVGHTWNFTDGYTSTLADPWHVFADDGFYPVTLDVITDKGCVGAVMHDVEIFPLPQVGFTSDFREGCQPLRIQFLDETTITSPYTLAQWQWDFGDGNDSVMGQFPVNIFNDPNIGPMDAGLYTVGLQVTSGNGCISSFTFADYVTEHPRPSAFFNADPEVVDMNNPSIDFTDLSSINVTDWDWELGDGSSSYQQHVEHTYQDTGSYPVTLYVTTAFGCLDTATFVVKVLPTFTFYIPNTFTPNSDGENETFYGQGTGISAYGMKIFDRWGEMIFESNDIDYQWDGTFRGAQVQQGVYLYLFVVKDWEGNDHHFDGHVNLMR